MPTFSELATAAYCPRKLYYERRADDRGPPEDAAEVRSLAFEYPALLSAPADALDARPIAVAPAEYRRRLRAHRDRLDCWAALADPPERNVLLEGKDSSGRVAKVLDGRVPVLVSAGTPPENGVWAPQSVRATAAALALAYRGAEPGRALVEYPAHAAVREVPLTGRRRARYRRTLRTVRAI
ncbi:MAG: hypothetical protein ABEH77_06450, partial [Halobacteriaceae archaeon]